MSEDKADSSDNVSRKELVYYYRHKRVKTGDGCIKTHVGKFVSSDFFGSTYPSNKELKETEDKYSSMMQELMGSKLRSISEQLRLLERDVAGEIELEQYKKRVALNLVYKYIIKKQEDEVKKVKERVDELVKAMQTPLPLSSPPPSQSAVAETEEAMTPQPPVTTPLLLEA